MLLVLANKILFTSRMVVPHRPELFVCLAAHLKAVVVLGVAGPPREHELLLKRSPVETPPLPTRVVPGDTDVHVGRRPGFAAHFSA